MDPDVKLEEEALPARPKRPRRAKSVKTGDGSSVKIEEPGVDPYAKLDEELFGDWL